MVSMMRRPWLFLTLCALILIVLWIPNLRYPLVSDPVYYAHTSQSFWQTGTYQVLGEPHEVFPPMHPILSYPFVAMAGLNYGMKLASLVYGILLMIAVFFFLRRQSPQDVVLRYAVTTLLLFCYTSTWLLSVGNADALYGAEFFLILILYLKAERRPWLYLPLGVLLGMTLLTRYMGACLIPILFFHTLCTRRQHLRNVYFWLQWPLAVLVFSPWLIRNKLTFGTWTLWHIQTQIDDVKDYTATYLLIRNTLFYLNPIHSIGLLIPLFLIGLAATFRKHLLLAIAIPLSILPGIEYQTASSRYLVATIPLMLVFVVEGIRTCRKFLPLWLVTSYVVLALATQTALTCVYTLPRCHAFVDRTFPVLPLQLGIYQESIENIQQAVDWVNAHAESGSTVISSRIKPEDIAIWESSRRLRADLRLALEPSCTTLTYDIDQGNRGLLGTHVFATDLPPVHTVAVIRPEECRDARR